MTGLRLEVSLEVQNNNMSSKYAVEVLLMML